MEHIQWYDYVRLITASIALWVLYRSAIRARAEWTTYTDRFKDLVWVFNALIFLLFEGSIEAIFVNAPTGPRIILGLIIVVIALKASFSKDGYTKKIT